MTQAHERPEVVLYTTRWCPFCVRALELLAAKGAAFREISVDGDPELRREMTAKAGRHTVPQIWIGATHVGGCDELYALERAGRLDALLAGEDPS
jgi:glutaredoxin 3